MTGGEEPLRLGVTGMWWC